MQSVVESEGEHCEWSVGLVAGRTAHGLAPKVVQEQLRDWSERSEILIVLYGKDVIVD